MIHRIMPVLAILFVSFGLVLPQAHAQEARATWLDIELGKSIVLETPKAPSAISITNPNVANFHHLGAATKLQIQGTQIGTTDLVLQFPGNSPPMIYEITVHRDLTELIRRIDAIVDHDPPRVYPLESRIVVQGKVDDLDTLEQVVMLARIYDEQFINLMTVEGDHQVQLEVVFAEVSRSGLREMGMNVLYGNRSIPLYAGLSGGNLGGSNVVHPMGDIANNVIPLTGEGALNLMFFGTLGSIHDIASVMQILDRYQLGKILAQPTLVCLSGQEAEFLAGGQIPMPIPSGQGNIALEFKDFGTKVSFVPTVLANNVIDLRVHIEMSDVDDSISQKLNGISVPGFVTRKAKSHIRLESGMSFALAGLLSERVVMSRSEVPGLGRIPLLGAFFREVSHLREETEVVIFVTPRLVRPMAPNEIPPLPGTTENNNPNDLALFLLGADRRFGSRTATPTGSVGLKR